MKLSIQQSTLLRVIAATPDGLWYPTSGPYVEGKRLLLGATEVVTVSKALWRKELAQQHEKLARYASWITDEGRRVAELERGKPLAWIDPTWQQQQPR